MTIRIKGELPFYVDVDDTLVIWDNERTSYTPHQEHINLIKRCHKRNQTVIVWSNGGEEWAYRIVKELGLEEYVTATASKPRWAVDDRNLNDILNEATHVYLEPMQQDKSMEESTQEFMEDLDAISNRAKFGYPLRTGFEPQLFCSTFNHIYVHDSNTTDNLFIVCKICGYKP